MIGHTRIYLIRHGQVNGFETYPIYGHTDIDLTDIGLLQMEKIAERLQLVDVAAVYSSDLKRSLTGAKLISRHHDAPLHPRKDLREMYFGRWEGLTLEQIREKYPEELQKRTKDIIDYRAPGGGESVKQLSERVIPIVQEILDKHANSNVVVVAHGAVNRVVLCHALALGLENLFRIQQDYGCLNIIDYFPNHTLVRLMNG